MKGMRMRSVTRTKKTYSEDKLDNPMFGGGGFSGSYTGAQCKELCDDVNNVDSHGRACVAFEHSSQDYDAVASCALAWACDRTEKWNGGKAYIRPRNNQNDNE